MARDEHGRLIDEIERFLATGEASPAAPEPMQRRGPLFRRRRRHTVRPPLAKWRAPVVIAVLITAIIVVSHHKKGADAVVDHASTTPAGPGYAFERLNRSGSPVRWNPCQAIHYVMNLNGAPPGAAADVSHALGAVSQATGLRFVDDGATTVIPTAGWLTTAAKHHSPVVIAWASASETDLFSRLNANGSASEVGIGGAGAMTDPRSGESVDVSGVVVIDRDTSANVAAGFVPGGIGVVLMHELGHLVGLAHTSDTAEIMYPVVQRTKSPTWGPGDAAGLQRLGTESGCLKVPSHRTRIVL